MEAQKYRLNGKEHVRYSRRAINAPARDLQITDRLLDRLMVFFTHRHLSTHQFHALHEPHIRQDTTTETLMHMKRAPNFLLDQPDGQDHTKRAGYNPLSYSISEQGVEFLLNAGRITLEQSVLWRKLQRNRSEFFHDAAASWVTFSIHLGCKERGLRFIPWFEILTHPNCPRATREADNPFALAYRIEAEDRHFIPDELCGIFGDVPIFYFIEMDANSETQKKTLRSKCKAYDYALSLNLHRTHFGFTYAQVLFVTLGHIRLRNLAHNIQIVTKKSDTGNLFKLKAVPELDRKQRKPLDARMLTQACLTPDLKEVSLFQ